VINLAREVALMCRFVTKRSEEERREMEGMEGGEKERESGEKERESGERERGGERKREKRVNQTLHIYYRQYLNYTRTNVRMHL
jgi:hypothetical protein